MIKGGSHTEEFKKRMSKAKKGKPNYLNRGKPAWNKGLTKETDERIKKMSESQIKHYYSKEARDKISKIKTGNTNWLGRKHSEETKTKISEAHRGIELKENNPNWKGGVTSLYDQIRKSFIYRQWRSDVFTRDDFTCQNCGQKSGGLNAHHIKSFFTIIQCYEITTLEEALECDELWNINNGITLCKVCHKKIHKKVINNGNDESPNEDSNTR